jgi:hypothetical protein
VHVVINAIFIIFHVIFKLYAKKSLIIYLRFILSNVCFSELHISAEMLMKILLYDNKGKLVVLCFVYLCIMWVEPSKFRDTSCFVVQHSDFAM